MINTLETRVEDDKIHSKRVEKMINTLETSGEVQVSESKISIDRLNEVFDLLISLDSRERERLGRKILQNWKENTLETSGKDDKLHSKRV